MYTLQFEGGKPFTLPNKKAVKVALKLYNMFRGEYTKEKRKPGAAFPALYGVSIGFTPFFPMNNKTPKGYARLFECYVNTDFLTIALKGYELNADLFREPERLEYGVVRLTPEEEEIAYKYFGHPLEDELRREIAVQEARGKSIYDLFDRDRGLLPYEGIPLILWNEDENTRRNKADRGEPYNEKYSTFRQLYGDRTLEDVLKEEIAKATKK